MMVRRFFAFCCLGPENWPFRSVRQDRKGPAFFAYSTNYLIDTDNAVIVDVEASRSIRQAEVGSVRSMLDRVKDKFDLHPERIIADTAYGSGPMLGWLVDRKIAPHIPVIDKAGRTDGTWSLADFEWDAKNDQYVCPEGQSLKQSNNSAAIILIPTEAQTAKVSPNIAHSN
jgi:hypothetical protein